MNVLLVGGLNVNPERFLPLIAKHNVFGIWESAPKWGVSVKAGGPYVEIKDIKLKEIARHNIDVVWSLLSPWDGLNVTSKILDRYPDLPVIRQTQGASTPWWHTPAEKHPRCTTHGNYAFTDLRRLLERCTGLMFVSERYRQSLIDQGAHIENIPYIISNGMAYNKDIIRNNLHDEPLRKLSSIDTAPHIALIGRAKHDIGALAARGIHVHYHSCSKVPGGKMPGSECIHRERYYGDVKSINKKPVDMHKILSTKQKLWYKAFTKYDAGLMHFFDPIGQNTYNGIDINVPGRVNTYLMHGLPPIIPNRESSIKDFLSGTDCAVQFDDYEDLAGKLRDSDFMCEKTQAVYKYRHKFSMQYELEHNVIPFLRTFL